MPMLYIWEAFDYVSLVNDLYWLSPFLVVTGARGYEQNLTSWMNMPIQLCTGIIRCDSNRGIECTVSHT